VAGVRKLLGRRADSDRPHDVRTEAWRHLTWGRTPMDSDLFDYFRKGEGARFKLERLSVTQRRLVSMKFVLAMISEVEKVRVTRHEDQVLKDGRRISILLFELDIGSFVFGIPQYTDSALVLIDLEIVEDEVFREGWGPVRGWSKTYAKRRGLAGGGAAA